MYKVYGAFQNAGKAGAINYTEELIKECATLEEAQTTAENQRGAWDAVIIRDQEDNEI